MYDFVIVTHLPAFYKTNLYNAISKKLNIYVIFIASGSAQRTKDFVSLKCDFDYVVIKEGFFENRSIFPSVIKLTKIIRGLNFQRIVVGGWDLLEFWWIVLLSTTKKNCLTLESTVFESNVAGFRGRVKKIFLSRIDTVFASGDLHVDLLKKLNFSGNIRVTRGVGIINKPAIKSGFSKKEFDHRYLYMGRLSTEKNLHMLVSTFNELPSCSLTIIGSGPLKDDLEKLASKNISFEKHIDNKEIQEIYFNHDFLILPSVREPWGLVVEEALFFGVPVIVSNKCGASELIEQGVNGYLFDSSIDGELKRIIKKIMSDTSNSVLMEIGGNEQLVRKDIKQVNEYIRCFGE